MIDTVIVPRADLEKIDSFLRMTGLPYAHGIRSSIRAMLAAAPKAEPVDAEVYLKEAISSSPQPLRDLGEFLSSVLDEDHWKTADRLLLAIATSQPEAPKAEPVGGSIAEVVAELVNETAPDQGNIPSRAFALALSLQAAIASQPEAPKVEQEPCANCRGRGYLMWQGGDSTESVTEFEDCPSCNQRAPASEELLEALEGLVRDWHEDDISTVDVMNGIDALIAKHKGPQS